jgi:hypothetical protein
VKKKGKKPRRRPTRPSCLPYTGLPRGQYVVMPGGTTASVATLARARRSRWQAGEQQDRRERGHSRRREQAHRREGVRWPEMAKPVSGAVGRPASQEQTSGFAFRTAHAGGISPSSPHWGAPWLSDHDGRIRRRGPSGQASTACGPPTRRTPTASARRGSPPGDTGVVLMLRRRRLGGGRGEDPGTASRSPTTTCSGAVPADPAPEPRRFALCACRRWARMGSPSAQIHTILAAASSWAGLSARRL